MAKENSQTRASGLPSEVVRIIGLENMYPESSMKYGTMVETLKEMYDRHGLEWIRKHREQLIKQSKVLDMF